MQVGALTNLQNALDLMNVCMSVRCKYQAAHE